MVLRLGSVVEALGGELQGDPQRLITALAPLESAGASELSFISHAKYLQQLVSSKAACVIVAPALREAAAARGDHIVVDQPYLYYARLTQLWKKQFSQAQGPRLHPSAVIDEQAFVDASAIVGPLCVVERGARIGAQTVLKSRVTVGENCVVGDRKSVV